MTDITRLDPTALPSNASLLKATGIAIVAAGALLLTTVLPAEYGIDPTGIGARFGLTSLSMAAASDDAAAAPVAAEGDFSVSVFEAAWRSPIPYRHDEMTLTLKPDQGAEIKASMRRGERMVFSWTAEGGNVNFDMHGEALNAPSDQFTSYWQGVQKSSGHGAFVAPFAGTHGWYWHNRGRQPVTITVKTAGFYEKLYRPS